MNYRKDTENVAAKDCQDPRERTTSNHEATTNDSQRLGNVLTVLGGATEKKDAKKESSQMGQVGARSSPVPLDRYKT
ncbi:hypothetical protein Sjap_023769 [Stephania japonica]|uniref:Uncharacterized protein n=1 Tax=Stephania japonica TaxID=461633 RepID=A0AAP0EFD5_9MAGN